MKRRRMLPLYEQYKQHFDIRMSMPKKWIRWKVGG